MPIANFLEYINIFIFRGHNGSDKIKMPPKRSQKYLPTKRSKPRHQGFKPVKIDKLDAHLYVQWEVPQSVELSPMQWEILTSSLCYPGALSEQNFPGNAELSLPILKIKFDNLEIFREFQMKAILVPRHTAYYVSHVCSSAGSARCIIADR